jgi:hypothetical protein
MFPYWSGLAAQAAEIAKANSAVASATATQGFTGQTQQVVGAAIAGAIAQTKQAAELAASIAGAVGAALQKQTEWLLHEMRTTAPEVSSAGSAEDRLAALERRVSKLQHQLSRLLHTLHGIGH